MALHPTYMESLSATAWLLHHLMLIIETLFLPGTGAAAGVGISSGGSWDRFMTIFTFPSNWKQRPEKSSSGLSTLEVIQSQMLTGGQNRSVPPFLALFWGLRLSPFHLVRLGRCHRIRVSGCTRPGFQRWGNPRVCRVQVISLASKPHFSYRVLGHDPDIHEALELPNARALGSPVASDQLSLLISFHRHLMWQPMAPYPDQTPSSS